MRDLTKVCSDLFKASNSAGSSGQIEADFNINASAICQCTATMNGEYLAFLSTVQIASIVTSSNPERIKAIMNNTCPFCGHTEWTLSWNG